MRGLDARNVILVVVGTLIIVGGFIAAFSPEPPPEVALSRESDRASPTSTTTVRGGPETSSPSPAEKPAVQVDLPIGPAKRFESVPITGTTRGGSKSLLQVQRKEGQRWVSFPVPTVSDPSGDFTTHVELDKPGRYWLRILDPRSGARSEAFPLVIEE
jgi:hypothetical protein